MAVKAHKYNLKFRPHFKTHQSAEVGQWFQDFNITKITVSSVEMARYFADRGWSDITIAFPVNLLEINEINQLAQSIRLNLLVTGATDVLFLEKNLHSKVNIFIKIDTGYHRSGIEWDQYHTLEYLVKKLSEMEKLHFSGFLTHAGHTYHAKSKDEILQIHDDTVGKMILLKEQFKQYKPIISIGDTPSCSLSENFDLIDEIRPGNFVYYDLTQYYLGSCMEAEIGVALACPVVDIQPHRNELVIYGGGVHLSKEFLSINGHRIYGRVVKLFDSGWTKSFDNCFVKNLSQEHGILHIESEYISQIKTGDVIGILPVHSCLTANLMKGNEYYIE